MDARSTHDGAPMPAGMVIVCGGLVRCVIPSAEHVASLDVNTKAAIRPQEAQSAAQSTPASGREQPAGLGGGFRPKADLRQLTPSGVRADSGIGLLGTGITCSVEGCLGTPAGSCAQLCNSCRLRYGARMPSGSPHRAPHFLRLAALVVLAFGLLMKPVLVAACEFGDLRIAQDCADIATQDDCGDDAGVAEGLEDKCCPGQICGECCTATTVLPPAASPTWMEHTFAAVVDSPPACIIPAPLSKAIRPPIVA